jgi:hypothetical protein
MAAELEIKITDEGADQAPPAAAPAQEQAPAAQPPAQQPAATPAAPPAKAAGKAAPAAASPVKPAAQQAAREPAKPVVQTQQPPKPAAQPAAEESKPNIFDKEPQYLTGKPARRFSQEQWDAIPENDRPAMMKQWGMGPPESDEQEQPAQEATANLVERKDKQPATPKLPTSSAQGPPAREPPTTAATAGQPPDEEPEPRRRPLAKQPPADADIDAEADKRLERMQRERKVEQKMRAQSPEYREEAEEKDRIHETADAIHKLNDARRDERIMLDGLTEAQRVEYLAQKEAERQREAEEVKERAKAIREDEFVQGELVPEAQKVPEVTALHDDEAYRKRINESMAQKARAKRQDEIHREMDPQYAKEAALADKREEKRKQAIDDAEGNDRAQTMAMGGAAIGGKLGRIMGIAAQVMRPATMRTIQKMFGGEEKPAAGDSKQEDEKQAQPPPPAANIPADERIEPPEEQDDRDRKKKPDPADLVDKIGKASKPPPPAANIPDDERIAKGPPSAGPKPPVPPAKAPAAPGGGAGAAAEGAGAAGAEAGGAGAAAGGVAMAAAEMIPVVGAAIAAAQMVKEVIADVGEGVRKGVRAGVDTAKNVVAMDADHSFQVLTKGFDAVADTAEKVSPVLGLVTPAAKEFVHGVDEMRGAIKGAAEKLSEYNSKLAGQTAQQEVAEMMRDIRRAQQFGDRTAAANEARFNMEQKMQDITDRLMPLVLAVAEKIFNAVENGLRALDEGIKMQLQVLNSMLAIIQMMPGAALALTAAGIDIAELRKLVREMIDAENGTTDDAQFDQFLRGGNIRDLFSFQTRPFDPAVAGAIGAPAAIVP